MHMVKVYQDQCVGSGKGVITLLIEGYDTNVIPIALGGRSFLLFVMGCLPRARNSWGTYISTLNHMT